MTSTLTRTLLTALILSACSPTSIAPLTNDLGAASDRPVAAVDAVVAPDVSTAPVCSSDRDCSGSGRVCHLDTGRCVQCNVQGDCAQPLVCVRQTCQAAQRCTGSTMCPNQVCSTALGYCVDCVADRDCPASQRCADNACVDRPRPCVSDRDCSGMGQVCNATLAHCVGCNADGDCAPGHFCDAANTCVRQRCVPSQTTCVDASRQESCDARGSATSTTRCAAGQTCRGGACTANVCVPGSMVCDPMTGVRAVCSADGSGATPMPCPDGQSCREGACVPRVCVPGSASCTSMAMRSVCNPDGLGSTASACAAGQSCAGGACVAQMCTPGTATCLDPNTRQLCNPDGLGVTSTPCAAMQRCSAGRCQDLACAPGSSTCVDARTVRACSSDGLSTTTLTCPGASTCSGTTCSSWVCTPGASTCASATSRSTCNPDGLGTTTAPCPTPANAGSPACSGVGICSFTCNTGFGDCNATAADGCEASLATSATHCGACGRMCPGGMVCTGGACTCRSGTTLCGSTCVNTTDDRANCGACGNVCTAGGLCVAGVCAPGYRRELVTNATGFVDACAALGAMTYVSNVDDLSVRVMLPFPVRYWGTERAAGAMINVTSNGWLGMDGMANAALGGTIPSTSPPNNVVAVFWDDLFTSNPGVCVATVGAAPNRRWVVEWQNTRPLNGMGTFTAEAVFHEGTGVIELIYQSFTINSLGTVGIEGPGGTTGVSGCPTESSFACVPTANSTVRFTPSL